MAWSVEVVGAGGERRRLHLLIEHQSTVDHAMALRFLHYGSLLYQRLYGDDRHGRWRGGEEVDAAECVVVYNGEREWTAATSLAGAGGLDVRYAVVDMAHLAADDSFRGAQRTWSTGWPRLPTSACRCTSCTGRRSGSAVPLSINGCQRALTKDLSYTPRVGVA